MQAAFGVWRCSAFGAIRILQRSGQQAASGRRQAASGKRQAASGKRQEASGKRQAASGKRQVASGKRQAASGKRQATRPTPDVERRIWEAGGGRGGEMSAWRDVVL
jgi:hypothetical protein